MYINEKWETFPLFSTLYVFYLFLFFTKFKQYTKKFAQSRVILYHAPMSRAYTHGLYIYIEEGAFFYLDEKKLYVRSASTRGARVRKKMLRIHFGNKNGNKNHVDVKFIYIYFAKPSNKQTKRNSNHFIFSVYMYKPTRIIATGFWFI